MTDEVDDDNVARDETDDEIEIDIEDGGSNNKVSIHIEKNMIFEFCKVIRTPKDNVEYNIKTAAATEDALFALCKNQVQYFQI